MVRCTSSASIEAPSCCFRKLKLDTAIGDWKIRHVNTIEVEAFAECVLLPISNFTTIAEGRSCEIGK